VEVKEATSVGIRDRARSCELPLQDPLIKTYPQHAYGLAVLQVQPAARDWLFTNYLHLTACPVHDPDLHDKSGRRLRASYFVDFCTPDLQHCFMPWLSSQLLSQATMQDLQITLRDVLRAAVTSNYYVQVPINEFYVPQSSAYRKTSYPHPVLVYGFDDDRQIFNCVGFLAQSYGPVEIEYDAMEAAFEKVPGTYWRDPSLFIFKLAKHCDYWMDPAFMRSSLEEYLTGTNVMERTAHFAMPRRDSFFGFSVWNVLTTHIDAIASQAADSRAQPMHLLYEHKLFMEKRIEFMRERNLLAGAAGQQLADQCASVRQNFFVARTSYLQMSALNRWNDAKKLIAALDGIAGMEQRLIEGLIDAI